MNSGHGSHQYPPFPPQQQSAFGFATTQYQTPYQTTPSPYPQLQQQHQPPPPSQSQPQQQHSHSQYFSNLPQGSSSQQRPSSQPQRQQQQQNAHHYPSTPHGPGAPPPDLSSPHVDYESSLIQALQSQSQSQPQSQSRTSCPSVGRQNSTAINDDDDDDDDQDIVDEDEPVYQLPPPPELEYENEAELEKAIHAWSLEHGYELVRRASKKNGKGQLYKRYYHCSKHGKEPTNKKPAKERRRANRKNNRIGCPMSLAAVAIDSNDPAGIWQIRLRKAHHNHPAVDATELAGHRRRARMGAVENAVDGLFAIDTSTNDVLKFLQRTQPDGLFKRTDVANMKLKWKKYGTCAHKGDGPPLEPLPIPLPTPGKNNYATACSHCRLKKNKCDAVKPVCGSCVKLGAQCVYDRNGQRAGAKPQPEPTPEALQRQAEIQVQNQNRQSQNQGQMSAQQQRAPRQSDGNDAMQVDGTAGPSEPVTFADLSTIDPDNAAQKAAQAQHVFAALAAFQQEHVKPTKLELNSSTVEVLASSTCGNGESYKYAINQQFTMGSDWQRYKDAFESAAVKENCVDVLLGNKKEPPRPTPAKGQETVAVEDHNEYVKQVAIFRRRDAMLKEGLKDTLSKGLWGRVKNMPTAHVMWTYLEDMCMPRGSDQAYLRFNELTNITLQNCGGSIDNYIATLELKYSDFNVLAQTHESRRSAAALNMSNSEILKRKNGGNGTFPEEMLCFMFLKGLGPQHQNMASKLMQKNNVGGFGSGERVTFKDLSMQTKRAFEWEASKAK